MRKRNYLGLILFIASVFATAYFLYVKNVAIAVMFLILTVLIGALREKFE